MRNHALKILGWLALLLVLAWFGQEMQRRQPSSHNWSQRDDELKKYFDSMKEADPSTIKTDLSGHTHNQPAMRLRFLPSRQDVEKLLGPPDRTTQQGDLVWKGKERQLTAYCCVDSRKNGVRHYAAGNGDIYSLSFSNTPETATYEEEEEDVGEFGADWRYSSWRRQ